MKRQAVYTDELCLIKLTGDAKIDEKPTLGSKNDMKNLLNFNASNGKSENCVVKNDLQIMVSKVT